MRFDTQLNENEVVPMLQKFMKITGAEPWGKKFYVLQQQLIENQFLREWQLIHYGIELKLRDLFVEQERTGKFPVLAMDYAHYSLYAFVTGIVRIYEYLSPAGQNRLKGMLLKGLQPDENLLSLQHEVASAVHLVSRGFDVEFNDIENGIGGIDFIARRDGIEIEVECKMFSGDIGRKITNRKAAVLFKYLESTIHRIYQSATTGIFVRITIPERLSSVRSQLSSIDDALSKGILGGNDILHTDECVIDIKDFQIADSPFNVTHPDKVSRQKVEKFVSQNWSVSNQQMMFVFSPGTRAVIVILQSSKEDTVLKGVYKQLRESANKQFTKTRPGYLFAQFSDLTSDQLERLGNLNTSDRGKATGLQIMTTEVLKSTNRTHIHTVAYRSQGKIGISREEPGALIEEGRGYFIKNPANPYFHDSRYDLLERVPYSPAQSQPGRMTIMEWHPK